MLSQRVLAQVIHADAARRRGIKLEPAPPLRAPSGHEVKAYRFTDVPKVGLNPVNEYATPLGTYWYPIYDEDDEKAVAQIDVPFGGNRKYVIEAIVDLRRVVVLDDVTESEFERYQRLLLKQITRVSGGAKPMKPAIVLRQTTEKAQAEAKTSGSKKEYWGRALWYLINNLSHVLAAHRQTKNSVRTATTIFNRLARLLDIDGFLNWSDWHVSRSEKSGAKRFPIIHPQEPRQMVLFTNDPIVESQIISLSQLEKRGLTGLDPLAADAPLISVQTLASKRGTPVDILLGLADHVKSSVRALVAANPSTPPEVLERLAHDRESTVRHAVAANRSAPPALLDRMSILDKSDGVRAEIAQNPSTPPEALERLWSVYSLLTDPESKRPPQETRDLFSALAGNPSTPPAVLEKLASARALHHSIASNPSTPPAVLERIALEKTDSGWGRLRSNALAVENPNFSQESFKKLSRDTLVEIVNDTTKASLLTRLVDHVDEKIRLAVAGREIAPLAVLQRLAGDDDKYVRLAVAHNRSTPIAALKRLATDLPPIRVRVAGNARTPASILAVLAADDRRDVRIEAASNVRTPPEALDQLARRNGDDEDLCFQVALNPSTPTSALDHLATNASRSIRNAVTEHPKSSRETLERLATTDEDDVIRRHARDELKKRFSASGSYVARISADAASRRGIKLEPPKLLREPRAHEVKAYRFTDTPKLGINPINQYATPVGTYWYPAFDKDDEKAYLEGKVEFGGDRKYIIEAIVDLRRVVVLDDVKEADFERYMPRLFKLVSKYKGRENLTSKPRLAFNEAVNRAKRDAMSAGSKKEYWGRALWYTLNNLSRLLSGARKAKDLTRSGTAIFNKLSQRLDIDGFLNWSDWHKQKGAPDKRYPIIHPLEPRQLVLFDNSPVVEYQILPSKTAAPPPSAPPSEPTAEALLTKSRPRLDQLALSPDVLVRLGVADNTATAPETLARLANDVEDRVRAVAAGNKYTPQEALRKLIKNGASYRVLLEIADNNGASSKTLSLLVNSVLAADALDSDDKIRIFRTVINRKAVPALAFSKLMSVEQLRPKIAKHPRTPPALLEILAQDKEPSVRSAVTANRKVPLRILQLLRKDENESVAYDALYALERAAASSTTSPSDLEQLAGDEDDDVRLAVAENLDAPPTALERLVDGTDRGVHSAVLKNPNTPPAVLERFAADDDDRLRRLVARHPNTPPAVLERLASDEDTSLRYAAGVNPATPPATLDKLASDDDEFVRRAVSEHRNTPRATLERLANDEDEYVRLKARKRLGLELWGDVDLKHLDGVAAISAKKKITRQDAQRMERDAKKHKNWKKKWTEVTQQPKKNSKGSWVGRATFEWLTGTDKGTKRSRPITLGDAATLVIRGGKLIVRPKGGKEYEYGDEESRKAAEAEQKRKEGKSPIDGLDTVQDLKKELLDNFETSLEMVDKFVRRERKRATEGTTAASTSLGARLDAVVETLSGLRLPTPTLLALEVAASALHKEERPSRYADSSGS